MVGTTISHYKVLEKIGEGGMGVVYRATDTKLNRDVALKILPQQFASDSQRMGRFQREAEVLASLDHPNIGQIYGIEEAGETKALVLQLIEGPTLAETIAQGPIPVEAALKIALQMAEGLEAAHEKGVIHRDLKPANIKITPEGQVKILDFGLAKALEGETPPDTNLSQSPTLTAAATQAGVILGTAAYMSPEQARGEATDKKADVWAFGCVLFEMLTGRATFGGKTVSDVLAGVLRIDPEWKSLPPNLHPQIRLLLERSLEKESKDRYHDIADARLDIQKALADPSGVLVQPSGDVVQAQPQSKLPWVLAGVVLGALSVGVVVWSLMPTEPQPVAARFYHELPDGQIFTSTGRPLVAVSPDGSKIVYVANDQLYLRNLDEMAARPIQGTDENPDNPFFSPGGDWVGYFSASDLQLKKIATVGGASVTLCDTTDSFGASWSSDGTILYGQPEGIMRVSANGGAPELVVPTEAPEQVDSPQMLPGGEWVLFTLTSGSSPARWDEAQIVVQSLESGERKVLWEDGSDARYVPTGHLVFTLEDVLFALPFDLASLEVSGGPVPIVDGVWGAGNNLTATGTANYGFSDNGTLVYVESTSTGSLNATLVWVDREGQEEPLAAESQGYMSPRISPDGSRLAITIKGSGGHDVWIHDLEREILTRLTFDPAADHFPVWTPDGQRIVFDSGRAGASHNLFWRAADGTGQVERLTTSPNNQTAHSISPDGKRLVFTENVPRDLQVLSMEGEHTSQSLFQSQFNERYGAISPDGHWIAYQSDESGQVQVYVRPFPNVEEGKWQISRDGGTEPVWAPRGQELFYRNGEAMMIVGIQTEPTFTQGSPVVLFTGKYIGGEPVVNYDISPDGQRFLMIKGGETTAQGQGQINVVLNWFEELKRLVPTN